MNKKYALVIIGPITHRGLDTHENINNITSKFYGEDKFKNIVISTWDNQDTNNIIQNENIKIVKTEDLIKSSGRANANHIRRILTIKMGLKYLMDNQIETDIVFILRSDMYFNFDILFRFFNNTPSDKDKGYREVYQEDYLYFPSIHVTYPYYISDLTVCGSINDLCDWVDSNLLFSNKSENEYLYFNAKGSPNGLRSVAQDVDQIMKYFFYKLYFKNKCKKFKMYNFFPVVYEKAGMKYLTNEKCKKRRGLHFHNNYLELWEYIFKYAIRPLPIEFHKSFIWFQNLKERSIIEKEKGYGSFNNTSELFKRKLKISETMLSIYSGEVDYSQTWRDLVLNYNLNITCFPLFFRENDYFVLKNNSEIKELNKNIQILKKSYLSTKDSQKIENQFFFSICSYVEKNLSSIIENSILNKYELFTRI